jgi:dienelactone hydrolase
MPFARAFLAAIACSMSLAAEAQPVAPTGSIAGTAWTHSPESLIAVVRQADVVLPQRATGGATFAGKFKDIPKVDGERVPVVVFLHGSSGLGLKAIGEWQRWLASLGYASVAPDSFALAGRVSYSSPIDKDSYERIHAMRASEIAPTLDAVTSQPWADMRRLVLAGASEGAVAVARYTRSEFAAKMIYSWSCEPNYFVKEALNSFEADKPVLNVMSLSDPFFSKTNPWLANPDAKGHCGEAFKGNLRASVVLIPDAPHTLLTLPAAKTATAGFLALLAVP